MTTKDLVSAIVIFLVAGILLFISILQFMQKGVPFNNAYFYANQKERETMDKKPHYRQCAITFFLLSIVFIILGFAILLSETRILFAEIPVVIGVIGYAVKSSKKNECK